MIEELKEGEGSPSKKGLGNIEEVSEQQDLAFQVKGVWDEDKAGKLFYDAKLKN